MIPKIKGDLKNLRAINKALQEQLALLPESAKADDNETFRDALALSREHVEDMEECLADIEAKIPILEGDEDDENEDDDFELEGEFDLDDEDEDEDEEAEDA